MLAILVTLTTGISGKSQDCESKIAIGLKNIQGGVYARQKVTLTNKVDGTILTQLSDEKGEVVFAVPCEILFELTIANYTKTMKILSSKGGMSKRTLSYEPNMAAKEQQFAMSAEEKAEVDNTANALPDTIFLRGPGMSSPKIPEHFIKVTIKLNDIKKLPLAGEMVCVTGVKRNKTVKGATDARGNMLIYLPKGDNYTINFNYNKRYDSTEYAYTKGISNANLEFSYLGTVEIEKRKRAEALRIAEEDKRLKAEEARFAAYCKRLKISAEEGRRRKLEESITGVLPPDTVITSVMHRNKWSEKLIVCDITGSMNPYAAQLSIWYQLNYKLEKNLQFIFFNDGDDMPDNKKVIGETGGIYYSPSKGIDSLGALICRVSSKGSGGDCAENNMEALIKGIKMAGPYKELVMIVDNNSPVKDIQLLKRFNKPVHIILCGINWGWVEPDYLLIAWKTKGSIHTIEEDITKIARMSEGQEIMIGEITYRIMGGEFVRISEI